MSRCLGKLIKGWCPPVAIGEFNSVGRGVSLCCSENAASSRTQRRHAKQVNQLRLESCRNSHVRLTIPNYPLPDSGDLIFCPWSAVPIAWLCFESIRRLRLSLIRIAIQIYSTGLGPTVRLYLTLSALREIICLLLQSSVQYRTHCQTQVPGRESGEV
jgi:hypothetical protein